MPKSILFSTTVCLLAIAALLAPATQAQPADAALEAQPGGGAESLGPCPLLTIAKGAHSGWGHDDPHFSGADLVIRDPDAWEAFWRVHTREAAPPPRVDFSRRVVIAAIQGPQPTAGGPNISIVNVEREGPFSRVIIVDDERPGPDPEVTNPFHIATICRAALPPRHSIVFRHVRPLPESGTVVGRVFAAPPEGEPFPLAQAHVALLREGQEPRHAISGRDGSYFFVNVEPGEYALLAEHPGFEPSEFRLFVPPETLVGHDFLLTPLPPEGGAIVGRVLGREPFGEPFPLSRALVRLFRGEEEIARRLTTDEGAFGFDRVPPGEYGLVASHEGFFPADARVEVEAGGVTEHIFVLEARPPEHGAIVGRVLGENPEGEPFPLAQALVQLFRGDEEIAHRLTTDDGGFGFERVPPGEYVLLASHEGFFPQDLAVVVEAGGVVEHVFVLEALPHDPPGAFVGRVLGVLDEGHRVPIREALVRLLGPDGEVARTHTGDDGGFAMHRVPPGRYVAVAEAPGWAPAEAEVEIHSGEATRHVFLLTREGPGVK